MKIVRSIFLLILFVFILIDFTACSGREAGRSGRRTAISWPGPEPQDLGGMVFKIMDFEPNRFFPHEGELGTPFGDLRQAFYESLMEDFNVTFEVIHYPVHGARELLQPAVMAGDQFAHMVVATQWELGQLIGAGLTEDLSAIPTLNLDGGMWWEAVHRATTIGGKVQATTGIFNEQLMHTTWVMFFQKGLWNELNLPDPYDLVRAGEWTWDRVLEYCILAQQDLTGDGVVDSINDRWGIVSIPDGLVRSCYVSQGGLYFDVNPSTGRLYTPAATPDGIAIANWMRNFTSTPGVWDRSNDRSFHDRIEMFKTGRALFYADMLTFHGMFLDMDDDWGILPMPKRNAAQRTYLNDVDHNAPLIGVPITNDQLEATGIIMEAIAARYQLICEIQREEFEYKLRSDDDIEMLQFIQPYTVFDIGRIMYYSGLPGFTLPHAELVFYTAWYTSNDFVSEIESQRDLIEMQVNEAFFGGL